MRRIATLVAAWSCVLMVPMAAAQQQPAATADKREAVKVQKREGIHTALPNLQMNQLGELLVPTREYMRMETRALTPEEAAAEMARIAQLPRPSRPTGIQIRGSMGPFVEGYGFEEIQVLLSSSPGGDASARWYFNKFFDGNADLPIYQRYGANQPIESTPAVGLVPGAMPTVQGSPNPQSPRIYELLLRLHSLSYTSRFGGSIALTFRMAEDYAYEFRRGSDAWDVEGLSMVVYVTPTHWQEGAKQRFLFNATADVVNQRLNSRPRVAFRFRAKAVTSYKLTSTGMIRRDDTAGRAAFDSLLAQLESSSTLDPGGAYPPANFGAVATRFAHAFVHTQVKSAFEVNGQPTDDKVVGVRLDDDELQLDTEHLKTYVRLTGQFRRVGYIVDYDGDSGEEPKGREFRVTATSVIKTSSGEFTGGTFQRNLPAGGETDWFHIAGPELAACAEVQEINVTANMISLEPLLIPDQDLGTEVHEITLDCSRVSSLDAETDWTKTSWIHVMSIAYFQPVDAPLWWTSGQSLSAYTTFLVRLELTRR